MGFLSVFQDSYENVKLFVTAWLKFLCVSRLGIIVGSYRKILLIVTTSVVFPMVVYRISCFLFDVLKSSSNPRTFVFLKV